MHLLFWRFYTAACRFSVEPESIGPSLWSFCVFSCLLLLSHVLLGSQIDSGSGPDRTRLFTLYYFCLYVFSDAEWCRVTWWPAVCPLGDTVCCWTVRGPISIDSRPSRDPGRLRTEVQLNQETFVSWKKLEIQTHWTIYLTFKDVWIWDWCQITKEDLIWHRNSKVFRISLVVYCGTLKAVCCFL